MASYKKEVNELLRQLRRDGFEIEEGAKKHKVRLSGSGWKGKWLSLPKTPSSPRWRQRARSELRTRFGYEAEEHKRK